MGICGARMSCKSKCSSLLFLTGVCWFPREADYIVEFSKPGVSALLLGMDKE